METRRDNYNLYDLGYGKNLSRYKPVENIETRNAFSNGISVSSISSIDEEGNTLDEMGDLSWKDVVEEIDIATEAITETKIKDDSISTPKIQANAVTSNKVTTGELITLKAQIRDAIIDEAHIDSLSADDIITGTLEGRTIRTGPTGGERIELRSNNESSLPNDIEFYDEDNEGVGRIRPILGALYIDTPYGEDVRIASQGTLAASFGDDYISIRRNIAPYTDDDGIHDLGASNARWRALFVDDISADKEILEQSYRVTKIHIGSSSPPEDDQSWLWIDTS